MKEHVLAEMINALRDVAVRYHNTQQLREQIKGTVLEYLNKDAEWYRQYEAAKGAKK